MAFSRSLAAFSSASLIAFLRSLAAFSSASLTAFSRSLAAFSWTFLRSFAAFSSTSFTAFSRSAYTFLFFLFSFPYFKARLNLLKDTFTEAWRPFTWSPRPVDGQDQSLSSFCEGTDTKSVFFWPATVLGSCFLKTKVISYCSWGKLYLLQKRLLAVLIDLPLMLQSEESSLV